MQGLVLPPDAPVGNQPPFSIIQSLYGNGSNGGRDREIFEEDISDTDESKQRALVVDDAPDVTEMIALFLSHAGYDAVMAYSANEALDAARSEHFDVIVSDIGMPGMNGYELAEALRLLPEYSSTPLIAVTGFSAYDDRGRALKSGFNAHLTKPINPMALLDLITKLKKE